MPTEDTSTPRVLTVTTGLMGEANQRPYNYVGTFPGISSSDLPIFGSPAYKKAVSYSTGVTAPWARQRIKFKV